jgi:hypothetical protein
VVASGCVVRLDVLRDDAQGLLTHSVWTARAILHADRAGEVFLGFVADPAGFVFNLIANHYEVLLAHVFSLLQANSFLRKAH